MLGIGAVGVLELVPDDMIGRGDGSGPNTIDLQRYSGVMSGSWKCLLFGLRRSTSNWAVRVLGKAWATSALRGWLPVSQAAARRAGQHSHG